MIRFIEIAIGDETPVGCTLCRVEQRETVHRSADDVLAEVRAVVAAWRGGTGPNVRLTGAEPFAHPELPRIVTGAMEAGCVRLAVDTDAGGLRSAGNAAGALAAGVRHIRFTLLGGEGVHDALVGVPGMSDLTREGVVGFRAVADANDLDVSVTALVPVCAHNLHDLPAAVGLAVRNGADRVEVQLTDGGLDLVAAAPWITSACDTGVVNGVWVEVTGVPFCLLPGYDLHLADAVRERAGAKTPVCRTCALDPVCAGAPAAATSDRLAALAPPPFAASLVPRVMRARGTVVL